MGCLVPFAELLTMKSRQVMSATFSLVAKQLGGAPVQPEEATQVSSKAPTALTDGGRLPYPHSCFGFVGGKWFLPSISGGAIRQHRASYAR